MIDHEIEQNNFCKITLELAQQRNNRINIEHVMIEQAKFRAMEKEYNGSLKALLLSWLYFVGFVLELFYIRETIMYVG